jgi:predicted glycosyltransferase involved in capsule biosynthesis
MSGCVAFTRRTYYDVGGFDPSFVGWGYPDYDFWMRALCYGCQFIPLKFPELHQYHERDGVPDDVFLAMNLWNGVQYFDKWMMPIGGKSLHALACHLKTSYNEARSMSLKEFIAKYDV